MHPVYNVSQTTNLCMHPSTQTIWMCVQFCAAQESWDSRCLWLVILASAAEKNNTLHSRKNNWVSWSKSRKWVYPEYIWKKHLAILSLSNEESYTSINKEKGPSFSCKVRISILFFKNCPDHQHIMDIGVTYVFSMRIYRCLSSSVHSKYIWILTTFFVM